LTSNFLLHRKLLIPAYFAAPVLVEAAEFEDDLVFLRVRTDAGRLEELTLTTEEVEQALLTTTADGVDVVSAPEQFLLVEAERIRLAYAHDPHFAVSLSGVEPLPHQLEAVYERLLPQARLRFLLADDPGAGKTIMAGLLIKELKMRGGVERVLVLCPAPLTIQWQDEMRTKFDEVFEIIRAELAKDQLAGNVWERFPQCITSIDFAKQDDVAPDLLRADWDLVIIDEAHKCAARWFSGEIKRTRRYTLAEALSEQADRLLLLTATPHSGDVEQFAYFLRLLDSDQFVGPDRVDNFAELNQQALIPHGGDEPSPWFLRRIKEELRNFDGAKLFTQRHAITVPFTLSDDERRLYDAVTDYINTYLPRQSGRRKAPVALARTVLQRRLASSVRAIRRSLERRHERFSTVLREVELLPSAKREQYLRQQSLLEAYDEEQDTDDADELLNDLAATSVTAAERIGDLSNEVSVLNRLVQQARRVEEQGDERKLQTLLTCLERTEFDELQDGRGKLMIFTEHKDTLDYLRERLGKTFQIVEIHGGMNAHRRKQAQEDFRTWAQICLATDAAGEGINLQFCHLMINYDMPWNPTRLEQRMGRVHRIGQKLDVFVFNFVATNTVEGRVLHRLLEKLDEIRGDLGDRVFDVVGMILRVNDVDLENILREAAYHPRHIDDDFYAQQIEHISADRLHELETATGVAMATSHVDLSHVQAQDYLSEERRLMPEYVEKYFLAAAQAVGLQVAQRADGLYRVDHVPQKFRATTLNSVRRFGPAATVYKKLTFNKQDVLKNPNHADAELLSPGHPLFAAVTEVLENQLAPVRGGVAVFTDPTSSDPYRLHFFVTELIGEEPLAGTYRPVTQYAALTVVLETAAGDLEIAPPDVLHDLEPGESTESVRPIDPQGRQQLERYVQRTVQRALLEDQRHQREREIGIRRSYLERTFEALILAQQRKYWELVEKVETGQTHYRIARDEAARRVDEFEARQTQKLDDLKHLRVLRPGTVRYLGSAEVIPVAVIAGAHDAMHSDPEVERRAMEYVMQYEQERGWTPTDVSQRHDGSGFDIRSIGPADENGKRPVRRIEVKGRSGYNRPVALTPNEWIQAQRHGDTYWLYVVWGAGQNQEPQHIEIQNPVVRLGRYAQPVIKHFVIPAEAIVDNSSR
jgi:superfamily II DNA or RNA helicase